MFDLSIVIAAYNEEKRLPGTLDRMINFFKSSAVRYEVVLVNDGSTDNTLMLFEQYAARYPFIKTITHTPNRGRGFAIRKGVFATSGDVVLETDADGSVAEEAILRFLNYLKTHSDIDAVFGSRELNSSRIAKHQPFLRVFLGYGFIYIARLLLWSWNTTDFTLGFKMFRQAAASDIFSHQFDNHYVAEAEIVYVAKRRGWKTAELPVVWSDNRDSRVHPLRDSLRSLIGLLHLHKNIFRGKYKR